MTRGKKISIDSLLKKREDVCNLIEEKKKELDSLDASIDKCKLTKLEDVLSTNNMSFDDLFEVIKKENTKEMRNSKNYEDRAVSSSDEKEKTEDEI